MNSLPSMTAVRHFMTVWSDLLSSLGDDYSCYLTCDEADAAADLYGTAGEHETAEAIMEMHAEDCDDPGAHNGESES